MTAAELPADITALTASQLSAAIRERQVSCVEVMQAYLERIQRYNPLYNALVSLRDPDECIADARVADEDLARSEYRGWMHGMPHAVKDLSNAAGLPTSNGSPLAAGTMPEADDPHIARIRKAGAIFIGKTNVPEFGMGSQSYNSVFGVTRNAWNPALTAGGSSGGAAAGLATQMLPTADGSDMMGSLRNPAAFNNVIGFRPSMGRVPQASTDLFYSQLSVNGPMGRNVEDTVRLLHTLAGFHPQAPLTMRDTLPDFDDYSPRALDGLKIGWLRSYGGYLAMEAGVIDVCESALKTLEQHGADVVYFDSAEFPLEALWEAWLTLRHWSHAGRQPWLEDRAIRSQLKPEMIFEIEGSLRLTAADIHAAGETRTQWFHLLDRALDSVDLLALPSAQVFPFSADTHWPAEIAGRSMDTYHRWMEVVIAASMAGIPAVSVPAGFSADGRPMGLQFMGRFGDDRKVLEFAQSYTLATGCLDRRPALRTRL